MPALEALVGTLGSLWFSVVFRVVLWTGEHTSLFLMNKHQAPEAEHFWETNRYCFHPDFHDTSQKGCKGLGGKKVL